MNNDIDFRDAQVSINGVPFGTATTVELMHDHEAVVPIMETSGTLTIKLGWFKAFRIKRAFRKMIRRMERKEKKLTKKA